MMARRASTVEPVRGAPVDTSEDRADNQNATQVEAPAPARAAHRRPTETYQQDGAPRSAAAPAVWSGGLPTLTSAPCALALIGGLWLIVSRLVYNYPAAGSGTAGLRNGVVIGAAVALIAIARLVSAGSNPTLSLVNVVLGGWMIASPWVYGYDRWTGGFRPAWSDVITGAVIAAAALVSWLAGTVRQAGAARATT
jgi:hypothetical protein